MWDSFNTRSQGGNLVRDDLRIIDDETIRWALVSYAYTSNTTRAGYSRADQFYASYPAGTELLTDTAKLYKVALGNCFEVEEWGPIEYCIMAKHFERQGKSPYAYHAQYMAHLLSNGQLDGSG
ncbi:hypothetical protein CMV_011191 [Castanea mollissima]|uniref:Uncharacterized protein n=1 Tax=Castanea mollissima TaxID=60419 RepID=A0A8J4RHX3_9ROSI|nr:hypothetical protein CMV_011191 [Castanea mollissima]